MKTLLISGGSYGIGLATVKRFCAAGYRVFSLDIKPPKEIILNAEYIHCDVADLNQISASVHQIKEKITRIDALVNNAGIHFSGSLLHTNAEQFTHVMNINFRSAFFLTQMILPFMQKQQKGSIVFIGSDQSMIAKKNSAIYGASKAALENLAKTTALDYATQGIRANVVAAGTIDTPLYHAAIKQYCEKTGAEPATTHQFEAAAQPLGRIGQPEEVAHLIYFLCSDEAAFITGGVYPIDGGYTAQ